MRSLAAITLTCALAVSATVAAAPAGAGGDQSDVTVRLVTHDSFAVSKSVLRDFTKQTGIDVEVLPAGDGGSALEPGDPHEGRARSATCSSASTTRS